MMHLDFGHCTAMVADSWKCMSDVVHVLLTAQALVYFYMTTSYILYPLSTVDPLKICYETQLGTRSAFDRPRDLRGNDLGRLSRLCISVQLLLCIA